jgi:hypothetical protein
MLGWLGIASETRNNLLASIGAQCSDCLVFRTQIATLLALTVLAITPALEAQPVDDATRGAARNLGQEGVEAYQGGDFATASTKLDKAYRTLKAPSLGLWSARALVKLGKLVEASERYVEVTRLSVSGGDTAVQRQAQADAESELTQLRSQIPNVIVQVEGAAVDSATITVDGVPLVSTLVGERRPINPGKHVVQGTSGSATVKVEVELTAGETKTAVLSFAPGTPTPSAGAATPEPTGGAVSSPSAPGPDAPPAGKKSFKTLGFVALSVGAAGLVVGGVTGGLALGKKSDIDSSPNCDGNRCERSEADLVDSYSTLRTVSTVGFIAGAVLAATGAVLVLTSPKEPEQVALRVGPGMARLEGRF